MIRKCLTHKSILVGLFTMVVGSIASAQDIGVIVGYRSDSADSDNALMTSMDANAGYQAGLIGKFGVGSGPLWIRSGFIYNQRTYTGSYGITKYNFKASYFEVPVGLLYKFSDFGGVFAGAAVNLNLANSCSFDNGTACTISGLNSSPISAQLGASFKVAPQFGFELYYEQTTSKLVDTLKNPRAIIANLMITFD